MKYNFLYKGLLMAGVMGMFSGCSDFGDTNIDPEHLNENNIDHRLVFSNAQHQGFGTNGDIWTTAIIYSGTMMQHVTTLNYSEVFYTYSSDYNGSVWDCMYAGERGPIRDIQIVLNAWKDKPGYENDYQIARIMKAYLFHRVTDLYGDIPYTEAAAKIDFPRYDKQKDIYADLLKELDEAQAALQGTSSMLKGQDFYYKGNIGQWKKFANSLMLRIAMRMSKVNPAEAEKWVRKSVENGLFESIADNAILYHTDGDPTNDSAESYGKIYSYRDAGRFFLSDYFVNMLKDSNDPRLALIGVVCESDPTENCTSKDYVLGNPDPAKQVGMPVGYDLNEGAWDISNAPGFPGKDKYTTYYSTINRYTFSSPKAPSMVLTYAENQLLLAEAAYRNWLNGLPGTKTAEEYYNEGVKAAMKQFVAYTEGEALYKKYLTDEAIDTYLLENPFDVSKALEQINTQYYITTFCDEYETFANWRRSGYPILTPVDKGYPNCVTNGTIPRRFTYPIAESSSNTANYQEGVAGLSPAKDLMTSRVWWDIE